MAEHIRIGDVAPRVHYVASGGQNVFIYPFPIFEPNDIEVRVDGLLLGTGYTVAGAGTSTGGTVAFDVAPSIGTRVLLRRRLRPERTTDFQSNGVLRAAVLNDELDRQTAAIQEVADDLTGTIRLDPGETGKRLTLPLLPARANRLLGFDSLGDLCVVSRDEATLSVPFPGGIPRTVGDKLNERLSARDFGATGDGVTDDGSALQAAMNAAALSGKHLEIGAGTYRTTVPLVLPGGAAGLTMQGAIVYAGPDGQTALTLGEGGAVSNRAKVYQGLRVLRATISSWDDENDIGVVARNCDSTVIDVRQIENFTIGLRTVGVDRGFEDSVVYLGRMVNNRVGLDVHTASAASWNTSVRYYGGHFALSLATYPNKDRFGVRFSAAPGAYVAHNRHVFDGPAFELQTRARPEIVGIPFLCEVNSRSVVVRNLRMEGCDEFVARHTAGAQDHVYEVAWASQGYGVSVDYTASATRVGAVVRAMHQAAAHRDATRLLAEVGCLRAAAIRWSSTEVGFEKLACLSTNVSGSPTKLSDFTWPALDSYGLTFRGAVLTGGRGLGFVVDARSCREFALAVDADNPRLVVQCFGSDMELLTSANGNLVRASGMSLSYVDGPRWWQGNADLTDEALTRLQVVRLDPSVAYAIIGVARVSTDYEVRSMRLYCDPAFSPPVLYNLPDLAFGTRQIQTETPWDLPPIPSGGTTQTNIALPGLRPGDFIQASFSLATSGVMFMASYGGTINGDPVVTVVAWNRSTVPIDLGAGTLRLRAVKS